MTSHVFCSFSPAFTATGAFCCVLTIKLLHGNQKTTYILMLLMTKASSCQDPCQFHSSMHQSIQTVPTLILPCVIIFRGAGSGLQQHLQVEASRPNRTRRQRHSVQRPVTPWADTGPNRCLPIEGSGNNSETGAATQSVQSGGSYGTSSGH